jgi:alpha-1,3-rhamnosyl/mannosyltransferase
MRVVINQMPALGQRTGIGHYTGELLRCLRRQAGSDRIEGWPAAAAGRACHFLNRIHKRIRAHLRPAGQNGTSLPGPANRFAKCASRLVMKSFDSLCRTSLSKRKYDLYHEVNFIPLPSDLPIVATLHDLSAVLYPEWHPAERIKHFSKHFDRARARCEHFFAISEAARQEIIRTLNIPAERITLTYMGVRSDLGPLPEWQTARILKKLSLPPRFLLSIGTLEPRKNILVLLRAYCSLPAPVRNRWPLVLVGGWGWRTEKIAEYYHAEARHRNVRHLGYVADQFMAALYNGARALVYPSLYEGFGLPPVEMLACGGAVLASTAAPIVETVGGQAHLIPAQDIDGWRDGLLRVVEDDDWWMSLRHGAVEKARPFTWEHCAAETLKVYRNVCGVRVEEATDKEWARRAAG